MLEFNSSTTYCSHMTLSPGGRGRVLLASASFGGTIAAVRHLAANGFDVGVLSSERLGAATWSRCASRSHRIPAESDNRRFLDQLIAIGEADPGQILLPTSDQTASLYANHADQLGRVFRMRLPPSSVIRRILDKSLLAPAAGKPELPRCRVGILWTPPNSMP
jgi:D-aspartate ligase